MHESRGVIYGLFDETNELRYIGQTINDPADRLRSHLNRASLGDRSHKNSWIRKHGAQNIRIEVLEEPRDLDAAERWWICTMRHLGVRLTNTTDGGGGTRGWKLPPEHRTKLMAANSLDKKGKPLSPEHRAKLAKNARKHATPERMRAMAEKRWSKARI